jgi:hypothetical protein
MLFQLIGDNVLIEFLPHGCIVVLVSFHHTIDGAIQRLKEKILDGHTASSLPVTLGYARGTSVNAL